MTQSLDREDAQHRVADRLVAALGLVMAAGLIAMFVNLPLVLAWCGSLALALVAALGIARRGQFGPFKVWLAAATAVWLAAFSAMFLLPAGVDHLFGGLPQATAVAVYVLWPAPFLLVTLPYALHFHRHVMPSDEGQP